MDGARAGVVLWFTGLPSSGKSTIARRVESILLRRGLPVELLDGHEVRQSLSRGLGFSREDREEHVRRIGYVAKLLSRNGVIAVCAAVSPYRATRDEIRSRVTNFVEIYVDCPLEVAESRDPDGMYARARAGEIEDFTGISDPYEPPEQPEVHIFSDRESVDSAAAKVVKTLELLGLIPPGNGRDGLAVPDEEELRWRLAGLGYL
ncbi:MAG TPA: adenylyl-sulfate kinase [Gemmatimonadaceae bacterium]|nr:adenylyl-sulfate kinase [Gemmatimonadaceae bacterium]